MPPRAAGSGNFIRHCRTLDPATRSVAGLPLTRPSGERYFSVDRRIKSCGDEAGAATDNLVAAEARNGRGGKCRHSGCRPMTRPSSKTAPAFTDSGTSAPRRLRRCAGIAPANGSPTASACCSGNIRVPRPAALRSISLKRWRSPTG
jgi:hypothetical protein